MNSDSYSRKKIAIRLLYTLLFLIVFAILTIIIKVSVMFQYVYLFISKTHNDPVRKFSNKVSVYAYKVLRYVTLNENEKPYPFKDFPTEFELPDKEVIFE